MDNRSRIVYLFVSFLLMVLISSTGAVPQAVPAGRTIPINGIEMYYETSGEGEPLVLLHGFMQSHHSYDPFIEEFAGRYRVVAVDLRGHGTSTNPSGEFTMRQSARDIFALLDHLEIEQFRAIGISAGAVTLLHMATMRPERVVAMVLIGSGSYYPNACRETLVQFGGKTYSEAEMGRLRAIHTHGDEQIRSLLAQLAGLAESYEDLTFTPPTLSTITARTLLVQGDRDYCFPVPMIGEMYASIPDAYLWVVPNGGHVPIYGPWASTFSETALMFLGGGWERK